jgi:hypothetical protein
MDITERDRACLSSSQALLRDPFQRGETLFDKVIALAQVERVGREVSIDVPPHAPVAILDNNVMKLQGQLEREHGLRVPTVNQVRNLEGPQDLSIVSSGAIVRVYGDTNLGPADGEIAVFKRSIFIPGTQTMVAYPGAMGNPQGRWDADTPGVHGLRELNEELAVGLRRKGESQVSAVALLHHDREAGLSWVDKEAILVQLRQEQAKQGLPVWPDKLARVDVAVADDPDAAARGFNITTRTGDGRLEKFKAGAYFETKGATVELARTLRLVVPKGYEAELVACEPFGRPVQLWKPEALGKLQDSFEGLATKDYDDNGGVLCTLEPLVRGRFSDLGTREPSSFSMGSWQAQHRAERQKPAAP